MWDEENDIFEALEEHGYECESSDDFSDLALDSSSTDYTEEDMLDEDGTHFDYES